MYVSQMMLMGDIIKTNINVYITIPQFKLFCYFFVKWTIIQNHTPQGQPIAHKSSVVTTVSSIKHIEAETKLPKFRRRHFQMHFLNGNVWISQNNSQKFVPKVRIDNAPASVQVMAWETLTPSLIGWTHTQNDSCKCHQMTMTWFISGRSKLAGVMSWCRQTANHHYLHDTI